MANVIVAQLLYLDAVDPNKVSLKNETVSLCAIPNSCPRSLVILAEALL